MCKFIPAKEMNSQRVGILLTVNGRQEFDIPTPFSYQTFDMPKVIDGLVVVKARIGMSDRTNSRFYIVVDKNGGHHFTEVTRDKV